MKDVTVALELTLPKAVSDQEIKSFVEEAIKEHLDRLRKEHFYNTSKVDWKETSWDAIQWAQLEILGIFEHMIDVVAIKDGMFNTRFRSIPGWRELELHPSIPHPDDIVDAG